MKNIIITTLTIFIVSLVGTIAQAEGNVSFEPGKGFVLETDDHKFKLQTRLRLQILSDTSITDSMDGNSKDVASKFMLRRARVTFKGYVYDPNNTFELQIALSPKDLGMTETTPATNSPLLDFYFDFTHLRDFNIKIGQYKMPYNREWLVSSGNLSFIDRSIVNKEFSLNRDTGITFHSNDLFGLHSHLKYYAGVYTGIGKNVTTVHDFNLAYLGRFEILPTGKFQDEYTYTDFKRYENAKLALGFTYAYLDGARKDKGMTGNLWDDGNVHNYHNGETDLMIKWRGLNIHTEGMMRIGTHKTDRNGWGLLQHAGYLLPSNKGIELVGRYGTNHAIGAKSSLVNSNELLGGIDYYVHGHPFKIQLDAGQLWSDNFYMGQKKVRVQFQGSF